MVPVQEADRKQRFRQARRLRARPTFAEEEARSRKAELRVLQCCAHALAAFLDISLGQADEIERGQAVGEMHFDANERSVHAGQGA